MEPISTFDMFKIGVGPSSSHTMGPWEAVRKSVSHICASRLDGLVGRVVVHLYGSLAKTGKGHGTDLAVMMGLSGEVPATTDVDELPKRIAKISKDKEIWINNQHSISFDPRNDILFHWAEILSFHPNGMKIVWYLKDSGQIEETYYSIGGGFVVQEGETASLHPRVNLPYPVESARDWRVYCDNLKLAPWEVIMENEKQFRSSQEIREGLMNIWNVMLRCMHRGCNQGGELPGGLHVTRRAYKMYCKLWGELPPAKPEAWMAQIRQLQPDFQTILKWVSCFALAVNEENASFGRVVTAPTNGAAGVIPAVMMYMNCFCDDRDTADIIHFLLIAGEVGSLFKKRATISAALGGCQAEIGVSSAMAAAGLTACLGGEIGQVLMAAEIAMEHHLGLTCDPIGGLVQIPCIERNTMGAIKAITASHIALESDPASAKVSLDDVIETMWETAQDMHSKYKETSEGGLALRIPVNVSEC